MAKQTKPRDRAETARRALLFWCLFIGVGAVGGAVGMLVAPDGSALGMQAMLPAFQVLPFADALFQDFVFPGIALLCVNGLTNLTAAAFLLAKKRVGLVLGMIFGVTLMLWITIQFVIFPFNFMSTAYFVFGLAQAATGYAALVFDGQNRFRAGFSAADYPRVGTDPRTLVVYFSRMGYVRRLAYETADALGADIRELKTTEPTAGTGGFWWCGRFGMHRWPMPVLPLDVDISSYEKITVCSPVWVFAPAAPVRAFLAGAKGKIRRVDYVISHFQGVRYARVFRRMDALLGIQHENARSVRCRVGRFRDIR